eukprot:767204-Hanusia_phi.AAC.1
MAQAPGPGLVSLIKVSLNVRRLDCGAARGRDTTPAAVPCDQRIHYPVFKAVLVQRGAILVGYSYNNFNPQSELRPKNDPPPRSPASVLQRVEDG